MADDLPEHRVAITVFTTVESIDERDGGHIATYAIRKALEAATNDAGNLVFEFSKGTRTVHIHDVMDTGTAAGNGYLRPTPKPYRERA